MDVYNMIRDTMRSTVPFAAHAGVELEKVEPGKGRASLQQTTTSINHMGTQHSAALFTLAETACGGALAATFAPVLFKLKAVTKSASIEYLSASRGKINANATCVDDSSDLLETLKSTGSVDLTISVSLSDETDKEVGKMTSEWKAMLKS